MNLLADYLAAGADAPALMRADVVRGVLRAELWRALAANPGLAPAVQRLEEECDVASILARRVETRCAEFGVVARALAGAPATEALRGLRARSREDFCLSRASGDDVLWLAPVLLNAPAIDRALTCPSTNFAAPS